MIHQAITKKMLILRLQEKTTMLKFIWSDLKKYMENLNFSSLFLLNLFEDKNDWLIDTIFPKNYLFLLIYKQKLFFWRKKDKAVTENLRSSYILTWIFKKKLPQSSAVERVLKNSNTYWRLEHINMYNNFRFLEKCSHPPV